MNTRTWPFGTTRRAYVVSCSPSTLIVQDDASEMHALIGTGHDPSLTDGTVGAVEFRQGGPTGGYWHFTPDRPILILDPTLNRYVKQAVHEDGSPWPERDDELRGLYLRQFDSGEPEDLAAVKEAYNALKATTHFAEVNLMMKHQCIFGAAHKDAKFWPEYVFSTHPDNIADWTDERRAAFNIRPPLAPAGETISFPLIDSD